MKLLQLGLAIVTFGFGASGLAASRVPITILHTNDLHSHFRPEKTPLNLGGVARLKTAITRERAANPNSFLVDGGDWSEGNIYYNLGGGLETLRMMEHLTYDVAVVGNHDWLNGPDQLSNIFSRAQPTMSLVGANMDLSQYSRADEFRKMVPPYVIREKGGIKVAFIGLLTYEFIYDSFFSPVRVVDPFSITRELAKRLQSKADVIVVISHNNLKMNEFILKSIPEVDLIVGAHDHKKLIRPTVVERPGHTPGWLVEAGCWGRYLGRVNFTAVPRAQAAIDGVPVVQFPDPKEYRLIQMDRTVKEDRETLRRIAKLEETLIAHYGDIFHDHIADNEIYVNRTGQENLLGNLATDAYLKSTGADLALDQVALIYGELHPGVINSVDVFNSNPAIYNPTQDKAWTLKILPVSGRTLNWLLTTFYSFKSLAQIGVISTSGMRVTYDPLLASNAPVGLSLPMPAMAAMDAGASSVLNEVLIQGKPLNKHATYRVAAGGGVILAVRYLNSLIPGAVPLDGMEDTGLEDWRVMADHIHAISPVTGDKIPVGNRIRSVQPDLGILAQDIVVTPVSRMRDSMHAHVKVTVRNFGLKTSGKTATVTLRANRYRTDMTVEPDWYDLGAQFSVPVLQNGETHTFEWDAQIPAERGVYTLQAALEGLKGEVNQTNDIAYTWSEDARRAYSY